MCFPQSASHESEGYPCDLSNHQVRIYFMLPKDLNINHLLEEKFKVIGATNRKTCHFFNAVYSFNLTKSSYQFDTIIFIQ